MATTEAQSPESPAPGNRRFAFLSSVHPGVFYPSVAILATVVLLATIFPTGTGETLDSLQDTVISGIG